MRVVYRRGKLRTKKQQLEDHKQLGEARVDIAERSEAGGRLENELEIMGFCVHKLVAAQAAHQEPDRKSGKPCYR